MANRIFKGNSTIGTPAYTINGSKIYDGNATIGTPAYASTKYRFRKELYMGYLISDESIRNGFIKSISEYKDNLYSRFYISKSKKI